MRILLTGAAGFIGSSLVPRLVARGDEVVGLDNFDETLYAKAQKDRNLAAIAGPGFRFVRGDFLDERLVAELVSTRPDAIVHLGGLAGVRPSLSQPKRYQMVNVEGTLNLLEACRVHGVSRFIFASSSSVYGAHSRVPFREDDPADRPASPYAATKRCGELFCSNYAELHGLTCVALRFFTVFGPRQRPEMAIHKFARAVDEGRPITLYGDGSTARDYTFIDDILDGVVRSIDATASPPAAWQSRYRVYNLGGSRTTTLSQLVTLIEGAMGKKARIEHQPEQPGDVPITFASVERAAAELGYAPKMPIETGLARFAEWYRCEQK